MSVCEKKGKWEYVNYLLATNTKKNEKLNPWNSSKRNDWSNIESIRSTQQHKAF